MDIYAFKNPLRGSADEARLHKGLDVLHRIYGAQHDIALVGASAIISLLEALIADDAYLNRDDLARKAKIFCRPDMAGTVDDIIPFFEGEDPRRHLWCVRDSFYRGLEGPWHDFPN